MELQLINVGRNKINKTVFAKNDKEMWRHIKSCLLSQDIELTQTETKDKYTIWAGMRNVGEIIIRE
jgi:hypothetical protein